MATPGTVDIPELLDRQNISGYQIRVAALCAAVVFLDGFDTQVIGNLIPSIISEFKVTLPAMGPVGVAQDENAHTPSWGTGAGRGCGGTWTSTRYRVLVLSTHCSIRRTQYSVLSTGYSVLRPLTPTLSPQQCQS